MGVLAVIKDYGTELLNAVRDNDLKTFKDICEKHLKHDEQISDLCTMDIKHRPSRKFACPLILAARLEDPSIIKYMMEVGTNPTFIHQSVYTTGKKEVVTPLHIAVDLNLIQTVDILLKFNADPNIRDHNDDTPLIIAVKKSNWMLMKMMLIKGGSPSITDKKGNAPLHMATIHGHLQMVKTLLKNNAELHQKGFQGAIPSHIAAREGHIHLIQVFCSADPGLINTKIPCFTDQREKAVMHLAAERGHAETVIALIDQFNADVNLKDSRGNTPLHCVVLHYYRPDKMRDKDYFYGTAKILVKYKTSINEKNHDGQTALHLAAMNNHPKIVELLLSVGANAFSEDNNRLKPIDVVPEDETVSKQLLKTAMLNPKPPINASSLNLTQNSSFHIGMVGDVNGVKNSFITKSMLESTGSTPLMKQKNISLDSSSMSIFANNIRHHRTNQSPKNAHRSHGPVKYRTNDKVPERAHHHDGGSRHRRRSAQSRSSESNLPSVFSGSSQNLNWHGYRRYSEVSSDDDTLTRRRSSDRKKRSDSYYRRGRYSDDDRSLERRTRRTDRSYAIARSRDQSHDRSLDKSGRKRIKSGRREHTSRADISESIYSDEDGVRVHKFPGKPKIIEVEYMSGPITIEFEDQDRPLQQQPVVHKTKSRKHKTHRRRNDASSEHVMKGEANSRENVNDWFNEMTKYNKNQKKKNSRNEMEADEWDEYEDKETKNKSEKSHPETQLVIPKTFDSKKQSKGKLNKEKFKQMKQKQYEEQLEMEKLPIVDPEPPAEKLQVIEDDSFSDDSSFDSESFEESITDTQKILNDSASKRILEVMRNVQSKWSQDEDEDEELSRGRKNVVRKMHIPAAKMNNVKKPVVRNMDMDNYRSNLIETLKHEIIKMETIATSSPISPKTTEDNDDSKESGMSLDNSTSRRGLNMRISGETPKAYTRKGKASARAKFILAAPARIESSSEASDSEQSVSNQRRTEWGRPLTPIHGNPSTSKSPTHDPLIYKGINDSKNVSCIKPYKSFGKIEIRTDALEAALDDEEEDESKVLETSFNTEASSDISPVLSKIIPEKYQIKQASKVTNLDDDFDETFHKEVIQEKSAKQPETEKWKQLSENEKLKSDMKRSESLDDMLEMYAKEPNTRKPRIDILKAEQHINKQFDDKLKKKKKLDSKFKLPDGLSPEVWEEASNSFPLASSDTYASVKKSKKSRHKKTNNSFDELSQSSHPSLDVSVPLISDVSDQSCLFNGDDALGVNIPSSIEVEDKKEVKKKIKNMRDPRLVLETRKGSHISKQWVPKEYQEKNKLEKKDLLVVKNEKRVLEQLSLIQSKKTKKPPKPSQHLNHNNEATRARSGSVEDLNELPRLKKGRKSIPKYPSRPYDVYRLAAYSDTETSADRSTRHNFNYIHSEAEASDFELPRDPRPGTSYKEAALYSLNSKILEYRHKSLLLRHPGHHDKSFDYLKKLYRPRRRKPRVRSAHLLPSAGKYGDREFRRVLSNRSVTESENEIDQNRSFVTDDEFDDVYGSMQSLTPKQDKKISPIYESLIRYKKLKQMRLEFKQREHEPIGPLEPDGVRFEKYDNIARIWMEQVDRETVLKSSTMYFKVLPYDKELPSFLKNRDNLRPAHGVGGVVPQWVVARTRFIQGKTAKDFSTGDVSFGEGSLIRKHLILFFKIGIDWMELAWVLFDGLSTESEVVRMIKDIQIKHSSSLSEQVEDLMRRWWHKKGDQATIQELQRALDLIQMFYIQEEIVNRGDDASTFIKYMETEDDLDTGEVAPDDPNVSHLCQEYHSKSFNNSFFSNSLKSMRHTEEFNSETVMRKLQTAKTIKSGMNEMLARVSRPSSRSQDLDRTTYREDSESFTHNSPTRDKKTSDLYHLVSQKEKQSKHETNL